MEIKYYQNKFGFSNEIYTNLFMYIYPQKSYYGFSLNSKDF